MMKPDPYQQPISEDEYSRGERRGRWRYNWVVKVTNAGNKGGKKMSGREEMDNILGCVAEIAVASYLRSRWTGDVEARGWGKRAPDVTTPGGQAVEVRSSQNPDSFLKSHDHEEADLPVVLVHVLPGVLEASILGWLPAGVIHEKGLKKAQPNGKSFYYLARQEDLWDIRTLRPWLAARLAEKVKA